MDFITRWARAAMDPPKYFLVVLMVAVSGLLNGIDTGSIGSVTVMPWFTKQFGEIGPTEQGLVVSSVMVSAAFTSFFAGDLSDTVGRPRSIALGALLYATGAALETASTSIGMLIAGRLLVGAGEGFFLSPSIVYVAEISPPRWRGALSTLVQVFVTLGLVVGFFMCYGSVRIDSSLSWRLPFAVHTGFAALLFVGSWLYLPNSPRWLSHHGRRAEATKVWDNLGVSSAEREKDALEDVLSTPAETRATDGRITAQAEQGAQGFKHPQSIGAKWRALTEIFAKDARKATLIGMFMVSMQQLSGIDGIIYYAPVLFEQAGLASSQANFLASGISAICIFAFTIIAVAFADRWGRRPTTIYGGMVLFTCMFLMSVLYGTNSVHGDSGAGRWVVITSIFVFAIIYSMTWGIGLRVFATEIQPIKTRATVSGLAQSLNCLTNFLVAFVTPILLAKSNYAAYALFSGCLALTLAAAVVYMPETKGQDLETVQEAFARNKAGVVPWSDIWASMRSSLTSFVGAVSQPRVSRVNESFELVTRN